MAGHQAFLARLKTLSNSLPRRPNSSALCTLCSTNGQRLHLGLLRQHFFFGLMPVRSVYFNLSFSGSAGAVAVFVIRYPHCDNH